MEHSNQCLERALRAAVEAPARPSLSEAEIGFRAARFGVSAGDEEAQQ